MDLPLFWVAKLRKNDGIVYLCSGYIKLKNNDEEVMSLMVLVCACLLSQPVKAQQVTPDAAGYIVKVGDMLLILKWS